MHLKLLNDTQHSHPISQSCLLKGKKYKMLQSKKPIKQRSSRRKSAPLTSVIKPSHSFLDLSSLKLFEHEWTNNTFTKSHSTKMWLFHASRIVQTKLNCTMITDKHSQTLIFWCQKSLSPTSNSKIHHLYSSIEQSDLSSLNSLNKNEHYKSASQNIQMVTRTRPRSTAKTSLMSKVPSKNTIL